MKEYIIISITFIIAFFCLPGYGFAQETDQPAYLVAMDSLVVTATKVPMDYRKTGRRVAVYTAAEIAAQPAGSVTELLRTLGGVAVQSRMGFGISSDFTIRGSSFKGVLVLLDGVPINGPQAAHYLSEFPVPLSAIARIEVMRGSASSLYGPNAIGGVIQIFTYAGLRTTETSAVEGKGGVHASYGSYDLYDLGGSYRQSFGNTTVYAATVWQGTDGESIFNSKGQRVESVNGPISTDFTRQTHTLAVTHAFDDVILYTRAGFDYRDFNAYHFYTDFKSDRARANNRTYWFQTRLRNDASSKTHWSIQLAAKQHEALYAYNQKSTSARDYGRKMVLQGNVNRAITNNLNLTAGFSAKYRGINSASMGDHHRVSGGVYVGANWQAAKHFTVNGSSRIDYDKGYGFEVTPQLSLAYNLGKFTVRAAASRAVRAPTYTELFINTAEEDFTGGNLGNPELDAEQAWSTEAGIDYYLTSAISFHTTVFYRKVDNLINWTKMTEKELFIARNVLNAKAKGVELGINAYKYFDASQLSFNLFYTYLHKEVSASKQKYALSGANQFIQANLKYKRGPVTLAASGLWKDRRYKKNYTVFNGRLAYRLPFANHRLGLSVSLRNIFDTEYTDIFDAPMPGRWWMFGIQYRL